VELTNYKRREVADRISSLLVDSRKHRASSASGFGFNAYSKSDVGRWNCF